MATDPVLWADIALLEIECLQTRLRNDLAAGRGEASDRRGKARLEELADTEESRLAESSPPGAGWFWITIRG